MKRNVARLNRVLAAESSWPRGIRHMSDDQLAAIISQGRVTLADNLNLEQIQAIAQGQDPALVFGERNQHGED